jgi:hypothetical protein
MKGESVAGRPATCDTCAFGEPDEDWSVMDIADSFRRPPVRRALSPDIASIMRMFNPTRFQRFSISYASFILPRMFFRPTSRASFRCKVRNAYISFVRAPNNNLIMPILLLSDLIFGVFHPRVSH